MQRRIDEMAQDVEESLYGYLKTFRFPIQLCQEIYFKYTCGSQRRNKFAKNYYLQTDTKGESIFHALDEFLKEKEIPVSNILSVATDGPAMIGRYRGFLSYLKK